MKDLKNLFKKLDKEIKCKVEISQNGISIEGSDSAILACLGAFVDTLEKDIGIDRSRIEKAIEVGFQSREEREKEVKEILSGKSDNLKEMLDTAKDLLEELKKLEEEE